MQAESFVPLQAQEAKQAQGTGVGTTSGSQCRQSLASRCKLKRQNRPRALELGLLLGRNAGRVFRPVASSRGKTGPGHWSWDYFWVAMQAESFVPLQAQEAKQAQGTGVGTTSGSQCRQSLSSRCKLKRQNRPRALELGLLLDRNAGRVLRPVA